MKFVSLCQIACYLDSNSLFWNITFIFAYPHAFWIWIFGLKNWNSCTLFPPHHVNSSVVLMTEMLYMENGIYFHIIGYCEIDVLCVLTFYCTIFLVNIECITKIVIKHSINFRASNEFSENLCIVCSSPNPFCLRGTIIQNFMFICPFFVFFMALPYMFVSLIFFFFLVFHVFEIYINQIIILWVFSLKFFFHSLLCSWNSSTFLLLAVIDSFQWL